VKDVMVAQVIFDTARLGSASAVMAKLSAHTTDKKLAVGEKEVSSVVQI